MDIVGSKRCIELDSRLARDLVDPLDWLLADSQRASGKRERGGGSTLLGSSTREECGISKTCFRATPEGEVWLLVTYARFLILLLLQLLLHLCLPLPTHSPCHQLVCSLIYLLPVSQMRLMIRTRTPRSRPSTQSHSQLESPFPYHAPMRRFAHLS